MAEVNFGTRLSRYGAVETLYVSGELDIATAPVLERAFDGALDGRGGEFRLDVGGLTFMDSSGAKSLMHLHNRVESVGRHFVVQFPTPAVYRVLDLLGLDQVLDIRSKAPRT